MSPSAPLPASRPPGRSRPSRVAVVALWAFTALTVSVMTALGLSFKSGQLDVVNQLIWDAAWIGWAPLTYVVLALCRRHPFDPQRKLRTALRLAAYGVGVVAGQLAFDLLCTNTLGWLLRGDPFSWKPLLTIVAFKAHVYYGVYWMIVGAAHAYEFHARYLESQLRSSQLETRLAQAELDRLKTQLQPHFLFNTHNTIVSLMLKQENASAIRMLTRLSDLLRASLSRSGQQLVTLREELETLRLYLEIQHERFRDRLAITIDAPADLHEAEVPHLLLQPLVENALHHGLENVSGNGRLAITIAREGDLLACTVRDNGPGFGAPLGHASGANGNGNGNGGGGGKGIGLGNTRERLQQLYGRRQSLLIESPPGHGCAVTIRIPCRLLVASSVA